MADLFAVLSEMERAEHALADSWAKSDFLRANGLLPEEHRVQYNGFRDRIYHLQTLMHQQLVTAFSVPIPGVPTFTAFSLPAPQRYPELPAVGSTPSAKAEEVGTTGLGVLPAIAWAAIIIVAIAAIAAWAYVLIRGFQFTSDLVRGVFVERENTQRYQRQVAATQERFLACLRRTQDPAQCAANFPVPNPPIAHGPTAPLDPAVVGVGIAAAVLSLGVVGFLGYKYLKGGSFLSHLNSAPTRVSRISGRPRRLSGDDIPRALTS